LAIIKRSSLLSVFLVLATAGVGVRIYLLWHHGGGELPARKMSAHPAIAAEAKLDHRHVPFTAAEAIETRNLFDPERGAGAAKQLNADSRSAQRVARLVLLGTAILGSNSYAIFQDSSGVLRIKMGDMIDGFSLAEIRQHSVVFRKGAAKVDLALEYLPKLDAPAPRRERLPAAPSA
jgi:hypothetical protein